MKKNNGITLVALVITIIILIILAGISISLLMGEDGLITKAKQGSQNYQNAAIEEQVRLNALYADFESQSTVIGTYDTIANLIGFKRTIASAITNAGVATSENDDAETMADNINQIYQDRYEEGLQAGQASSSSASDITGFECIICTAGSAKIPITIPKVEGQVIKKSETPQTYNTDTVFDIEPLASTEFLYIVRGSYNSGTSNTPFTTADVTVPTGATVEQIGSGVGSLTDKNGAVSLFKISNIPEGATITVPHSNYTNGVTLIEIAYQ